MNYKDFGFWVLNKSKTNVQLLGRYDRLPSLLTAIKREFRTHAKEFGTYFQDKRGIQTAFNLSDFQYRSFTKQRFRYLMDLDWSSDHFYKASLIGTKIKSKVTVRNVEFSDGVLFLGVTIEEHLPQADGTQEAHPIKLSPWGWRIYKNNITGQDYVVVTLTVYASSLGGLSEATDGLIFIDEPLLHPHVQSDTGRFCTYGDRLENIFQAIAVGDFFFLHVNIQQMLSTITVTDAYRLPRNDDQDDTAHHVCHVCGMDIYDDEDWASCIDCEQHMHRDCLPFEIISSDTFPVYYFDDGDSTLCESCFSNHVAQELELVDGKPVLEKRFIFRLHSDQVQPIPFKCDCGKLLRETPFMIAPKELPPSSRTPLEFIAKCFDCMLHYHSPEDLLLMDLKNSGYFVDRVPQRVLDKDETIRKLLWLDKYPYLFMSDEFHELLMAYREEHHVKINFTDVGKAYFNNHWFLKSPFSEVQENFEGYSFSVVKFIPIRVLGD